MSAAALWTATKARYDVDGLVVLTNIRDRNATTIDDAVGTAAAQSVIDLWPVYAETEYDATSTTHVEVAVMGVIAMLWRRGGSATSIEQVQWGEVFGSEGMIARVRKTGPRGRRGPASNSGVQASSELDSGRTVLGWSDRDALPRGILPRRRLSDGVD